MAVLADRARTAGSRLSSRFVAGRRDSLPPSSPDRNPIELIFAKVKQLLRSLAWRTRETLWATMQSVLDQVPPADAENGYKHCGYTLRLY